MPIYKSFSSRWKRGGNIISEECHQNVSPFWSDLTTHNGRTFPVFHLNPAKRTSYHKIQWRIKIKLKKLHCHQTTKIMKNDTILSPESTTTSQKAAGLVQTVTTSVDLGGAEGKATTRSNTNGWTRGSQCGRRLWWRGAHSSTADDWLPNESFQPDESPLRTVNLWFRSLKEEEDNVNCLKRKFKDMSKEISEVQETFATLSADNIQKDFFQGIGLLSRVPKWEHSEVGEEYWKPPC